MIIQSVMGNHFLFVLSYITCGRILNHVFSRIMKLYVSSQFVYKFSVNLILTLKLSQFRKKVIEKYFKIVINRWLNTLNICVAYWYFENGILSKGGADAM